MTITLCVACFPDWGRHEVYTVVPLTPCDQCGSAAERHVFPVDPRAERHHDRRRPPEPPTGDER